MVEDEGEPVRSRNHSIFSSSAPGTSVKKWRINHCQFFLGGSFRPSQHVSPQDLMRNDLRITRRGNTTNRPSRRPFLTSVVMPICLRIGAVMGLGPVGCRWVPMGGIICFASRCHPDLAKACHCTCSNASLCRSVHQSGRVSTMQLGRQLSFSLSALACFVQAATCSYHPRSDHQCGKTSPQRLRAKHVNEKAGKVFPCITRSNHRRLTSVAQKFGA